MQVDPCTRLRRDEVVVDEVVCVGTGLERLMRGGIGGLGGCESGGALEVL